MSVPNFSSLLLAQGCAALPHWAVLRASGADAVSFLQGQLTNDLALLPPEQLRLNAYCNPQGRMLSDLITWRDGPQDVLLALPRALLEATLKRLRMFVLRAQCSLSEEAASVSGAWGSSVPNSLTAVGQCTRDGELTCLRLPDGPDQTPRAMLICADQASAPAEQGRAEDWDAWSVAAGHAWLGSETTAAFVPQMLNWESLDGISFKKGCYPGQEVVARSQFRGAIKRRSERVWSPQPLAVGDTVWAAGGQELGSVVNAAPLSDGSGLALICVHQGQAEAQDLRASGPEGVALARLGLPYPLREDL
jgi:folate-binding protein YgfZ